jgi:hypothetical protein
MKRLFILALILFCAGSLLATQNRVATMGGEVAMLPDDDSNIDLFPQRVNDWSIVRFEDIQGGSPDYLLITGKKGNKWGFYGGESQEDYFFNVIKSMGSTSALNLGLRFGTTNEGDKWNNNENSPDNASEETTNKYTDIAVDAVYGTDLSNGELAIGGSYASGPGTIEYLDPYGIHGKYEYIYTSGAYNDEKGEGTASWSGFSVAAAYRCPTNFLIFNQLYMDGGFMSIGTKSEYSYDSNTEDTTVPNKLEDLDYSLTDIGADVLFFNNKKIVSETKYTKNVLLVYGVGVGLNILSGKYENKLKDSQIPYGEHKKETLSQLVIGGPRLRIGIEADLKCAKLRFGMQRNIDFFYSGKLEGNFAKYSGEDAANKEESTFSGIGQYGSYTFASGLGLELGRFTINLMLNNTFWCTGPQMIFNDTWGTLGASADVIIGL